MEIANFNREYSYEFAKVASPLNEYRSGRKLNDLKKGSMLLNSKIFLGKILNFSM